MFACPSCEVRLQRARSRRGVFWTCPRCAGRAVAVPLLRRMLEPAFVRDLWGRAVETAAGNRACPVCSRPMAAVTASGAPLDVCTRCGFVWFDAGELEASPALEQQPDPAVSQDDLEKLARFRLEQIAREWRFRPDVEVPWELVPGALGLPLEDDARPLARWPVVTWLAVLAVVMVSAWGLLDPGLRAAAALDPGAPGRAGGLTFLTSFFVHEGLFPAIAGIWFLAMFGDDVEDRLGHGGFALLLGAGALAGAVLHALFAAEPLLGTGGGVSAVVAFYGLRFPQSRLRYLRLTGWMTMPASVAAGLWLLVQLLGTRLQGTSLIANLGGAAAGALTWYASRDL